MLFGVGGSCRILYYFVSYLYESCSGPITSVGEERANLSAILFTCNYVVSVQRGFLGALDGLRYFIVALPVPCI